MGKTLLTGGAGYIGTHTCVELLEAGYEVVVADNYVNSSPAALARVEELTGKKVAAYAVDLCDKAALETCFAENDIEAVIHFAGLKAVGESVQKPLEYYRNNLDATLTLLEVMRAHGVKRLVFSSSATVYGEQEEPECHEEMKPVLTCSSPYGCTKTMIEQILRDLVIAMPDWSVVLLRYFNPVGAHPSGSIGEDPNGIPNNLMPRVLQAALGQIEALGVFGNDYPTPDGTCIRDYIHVVDLAKGHLAALKYCATHPGCEAINLGSGVPVSVLEIINTFERVNGVKVPYHMEPRRPGDLAGFWASPKKAERLLGWKVEKSLDDMCRDAWNWRSHNPNGYNA